MRKLSTAFLILLSTTTFAMSENSDVICSKMNQDSAYQEAASSTSTLVPAKTESGPVLKK